MWKTNLYQKKNKYHNKFIKKYPPLDIGCFTHIKENLLDETKKIIDKKLSEKLSQAPKPKCIVEMTTLESLDCHYQPYLSYNPYGSLEVRNIPRTHCQQCLCPNDFCANKVFGDDLLYYFKKAATEKSFSDFAIDYEGDNSQEDINERTKEYWNATYSTLVFAKAVNNGIDFKEHPPTFWIKKLELPQCICKGAFMEFFDWKAKETHIFNIIEEANEDYKPDHLFIKYFT